MYEQKTKKAIGTFAELNKPDESLSKKVVKGGFWVLTLRGFNQLFTIACGLDLNLQALKMARELPHIHRFHAIQGGDHPEHLNHWSKDSFTRLVRRYLMIDEIVTPFPWTIVLCHKKQK